MFLLSLGGLLPGRRPAASAPCLLLLLIAAFTSPGCSPTFNWRELRPQGTPLVALMPCKPEHGTREVPLAGGRAELHMHSCDAGGLSFAVAWVELGEASRAAQALSEWPRASVATLKLEPSQADAPTLQWPVAVKGAAQARGLFAQGTGLQGQAVQMRAAYFSHGSQVYQAAVYGAALPADVAGTFFDALQLP